MMFKFIGKGSLVRVSWLVVYSGRVTFLGLVGQLC